MKRSFIIIFLFLLFISCSKTFLNTGVVSEQNKINLASIHVGMTKDEVYGVMGAPYKIENIAYASAKYAVWYYITEPVVLGQTQLISKNFTPLIFKDNILKGWGRGFYNYTFNVDDEQWKRRVEKRQQYTDDKEEWPKNEHSIILPMNESKEKTSREKSKDKTEQFIMHEEDFKENQKDQSKLQKQPKNEVKQGKDTSTKKIRNKSKKTAKKAKKTKSKEPACSGSKDGDLFILWE